MVGSRKRMDDQQITWDVVSQLSDSELQELLHEEAKLHFDLRQVVAIRKFIKIAGDLEAAMELVEAVRNIKGAA
jgi:hypothetical protein